MTWMLVGTHIAAFVTGAILSMAGWHYGDFASLCRAGADAARKIRRRLEEVHGVLYLVLKELESMDKGAPGVYRKLLAAHRITEPLDDLRPDLLQLRDDDLERKLDAFVEATKARIDWGITDVIPTINQASGHSDPNSTGYQKLQTLKEALKGADIPACESLMVKLTSMSTWSGFARTRLAYRPR